MQSGRDFLCIHQAIWEADPEGGPVQFSKLDVTDTYHLGNLQPSQFGAFAYVAPLVPDDDVIIVCINLVFPMGWVESLKFFCTFS